LFVYASQVEHDRGCLHLLDRRLAGRRTRTVGYVSVARTVDNPVGQDRLAAGFGLHDHSRHGVAVHDRSGERAVQQGAHSGLLDEPVGDHLEALGVDLVGQGLRVGCRSAHGLRTLLEFTPDAPGLDGRLMPVPGQALDADHGEVAAEAPEPFQQGDLGAGPRRRDRRGETAGAAADDKHLGAMHDVDPCARARGWS
jgi:hypothetical protein